MIGSPRAHSSVVLARFYWGIPRWDPFFRSSEVMTGASWAPGSHRPRVALARWRVAVSSS